MSKHYVITGGAGFIGSNLAHTLAAREPEADITIIDDFRSGDFKNLEGFKGDLITGDLSRVDLTPWFDEVKVDVVFHLASVTDTTDHDQFRQCHDNIEGWRNLLGTFNSKKTRIVYASSAATYGIAAGINHIDQQQKPANVYAFTKVQLENLARIWQRSNPKQAIIGLRFFNVYGPRETHKLRA
ncbi:MAG: NAD-dependent epimerase/dehydratase family protein, partial [Candidatus Methylacidiphilales bacterium]